MILKNKNKLTFIVILAGILRIAALICRGPFSFDEFFTVHFSSLPLLKFSWTLAENHPPFFYFLTHFWTKIAHFDEFLNRLPALFFGLLGVLATFFVARLLFSTFNQKGENADEQIKRASLVAALLAALSPYQIWHSSQVRMYSMIFFLSLASMYFFWQLITGKEQAKNPLLWFISSLFLILTHIFGCLTIFSQFLYLFFAYYCSLIDKKRLLRLIGLILILAAVFLTWFIPTILLDKGGDLSQGWFFHTPKTNFYFFSAIRAFITSDSPLPSLEFLINSLLIFFIVVFVIEFKKNPENKWEIKSHLGPVEIFILTWLFIPLLIGFILQINSPLYFVSSSGAIYLIIGYSFKKFNVHLFLKLKRGNHYRLNKLSFSSVALTLLLVCGSLSILNNVTFHNQAKNLTDWIEKNEKPGDKIIIHSFCQEMLFRHYYQGALPLQGFYPLDDNLSYESRIIKKNWQDIVNEENVKKLADFTQNYNRIFLVQRLPFGFDLKKLVFYWFIKNNWQLLESINLRDGCSIYVFKNPK